MARLQTRSARTECVSRRTRRAAAFNIAFKVKSLSPFPNATVCIGMICTFCVHVVKLPRGTWTLIQAPLVVVLGGLLGLIAHGTGMN